MGYTLGDIFFYANFEQLKYEADGLAGATAERIQAQGLVYRCEVEHRYRLRRRAVHPGAERFSCEMANGSGCNADQTGAKMVERGLLPYAVQADPGVRHG